VARTTYRVRRNTPKTAPMLERRDSFVPSKDNFVHSKDRNRVLFCLSTAHEAHNERQNHMQKVSVNLRKLDYSPTQNPLIEAQQFNTKKRWVRTGRSEELINPATGEIHGMTAIHQVEERDDAEFVKVFAAGVTATYQLTKTAQRVFQLVLEQYQRTPMSRGFADYVNLFWFDDGIEGRTVDMSEKTFQRGLKELIEKRFIYPKDSASYWTNPALFFKGDRVLFIKEYRRTKRIENQRAHTQQDSEA